MQPIYRPRVRRVCRKEINPKESFSPSFVFLPFFPETPRLEDFQQIFTFEPFLFFVIPLGSEIFRTFSYQGTSVNTRPNEHLRRPSVQRVNKSNLTIAAVYRDKPFN